MLPKPQHFDRICRMCLSNSAELINLFESDEVLLNLLVSITSISIASDDDLPQFICQFCSHQIKSTHYFILKCQESDRKLRFSLNSVSNGSDDDTFPNDMPISDENVPCKEELSEAVLQDQPQNTSKERRKRVQRQPTAGKRSKYVQEVPEYFHCLECRAAFKTNDLLLEHMKTHTQDDTTRNVDHRCVLSSESPKSQHTYNIRNKSPSKPTNPTSDSRKSDFQCTICGKQTKHINHLKIHMRVHKDFNGDVSSSTSDVALEKKKQFLCPTCGKARTSRSNLAVHIRRHTGKMTNFCKICGKGYPRSTDLTIHMRTHTGEKPYGCTGCNRSFAQKNDLISHQRRNVCDNLRKNTCAIVPEDKDNNISKR